MVLDEYFQSKKVIVSSNASEDYRTFFYFYPLFFMDKYVKGNARVCNTSKFNFVATRKRIIND